MVIYWKGYHYNKNPQFFKNQIFIYMLLENFTKYFN